MPQRSSRCARSYGNASRRRAVARGVALAPLLAAALLATSAAALEFSASDLIYREDYVGESTYATSPEIDLIGAGGLQPTSSPPGPEPPLTGTAAHVSVSDVVDRYILSTIFHGGTHGTADVGVRGGFDNLVLGSDGTSVLSVGAAFGDGSSRVQVVASLVVTQDAILGDSAALRIEMIPDSGPWNITSISLSAGAASAILAGSASTVDLFVDRSAGTAIASIAVPGVGVFVAPSLTLTLAGNRPLDFAFNAGGFDTAVYGTPPTTTDLDLTLIEAYSRRALPSGRINVDVGAGNGTPSSGYGAAGTAGTWNTIGLGASLLADSSGASTLVTAVLSSAFDSGTATGTPGDTLALLGDNSFDCSDPDDWSLLFTGLRDGDYRVLLYAPMNTNVATGKVDVNGVAVASLPGDPSGALVDGTSYASLTAQVSGGTLMLAGTGTGSPSCAGTAGVQLEGPLPANVPALSTASRALLAALLIAGAWRVRRPR